LISPKSAGRSRYSAGRPGIPVVGFPGQEVPALEDQDPLARGGQRMWQRAAARANARDDHVVAVGHRLTMPAPDLRRITRAG